MKQRSTEFELDRETMIVWDMGQSYQPNIRQRSAVGIIEELKQLLCALFQPDDLIELRLVTSNQEVNHQGLSLVARHWLTPDQVIEFAPQLADANGDGAHVFYGVNPRSRRSGGKDAVQRCNALWADIDGVSVEEASAYWYSLLPEPSIVVSSGHGVHLYWLLESPVDVSTVEKRDSFESLLKSIQRGIGADSTHDVSRMLRLPGFLNVKPPVNPCQLINCQPQQLYSLSDFEKWRPIERKSQHDSFGQQQIPGTLDTRRIRGLVRHLQTDVPDRSRRDFGVVCQLLRLGVDPAEIWSLVEPYSKFATDGQDYFQRTIKNALEHLND